MKKFNVPSRKHSDGPKKMVAMRMPENLWKKVEQLATKKGLTITEMVSLVLDQYLQYEERHGEN